MVVTKVSQRNELQTTFWSLLTSCYTFCIQRHLGGEETYLEESGTSEDNEFDMVVGALEEIMLGDEFMSIQKGFCDAHCGMVDDLS